MEEKNNHVVFDCIIPFINDRNTLSLICHKSCEIDGKTRKHVTVHTHYATSPSRFCQRFPLLQSLTLYGAPDLDDHDVIITPWVQQITSSLYQLNSVCLKRLFLNDYDLELLAQTVADPGNFFTGPKFFLKRRDFFLAKYGGKYCNNLRDLRLVRNEIADNGENWLRELGWRNTEIEKLSFHAVNFDLKDLVFLAKNCSRHLVSVKLSGSCDFIDLMEFFWHAINLVEFGGGEFSDAHKEEYNSFKFPDCLKHLLMRHTCDVKIVVPFAHLITELYCEDGYPNGHDFRELIKSCCNLKVLRTNDEIGDQGLRDVSIYCKKLRKLVVYPGLYNRKVSHEGVSHVAEQCVELECLRIHLISMTNEVMCKIGRHMKNLQRLELGNLVNKDILPLDDGFRCLLIGCDKLEKMDIHFEAHGGLTDKGLGLIGKYGSNLRGLSLGNVGESDAGLVELSKGCPKLGYLETIGCPFSKEGLDLFRCNVKLRYFCVENMMK
ncbi:coronatine-insensitive protein 1-like [Rutidosis leptorrhynchoides]|uniref:coronatine-insensitive protein 1-like n=1 Tax=Rutidosis leptorrhynchoides TaxID=125765 RepID=UPI003A99F612